MKISFPYYKQLDAMDCGPCSQKLLELKEGEFDKICNIHGIEKTIQTMMTNFYSENIQDNLI